MLRCLLLHLNFNANQIYQMEFRTLVNLPINQLKINHSHKILLLGSCFANNIGDKLKENKFQCEINPYGTLYNPCSLLSAMNEIAEDVVYTEEDLFFREGQWHSPMHHSSFSDEDKNVCLQRINERICHTHESLKTLDYVIVTYGSAYVYEDKKTGEIVGNCHKRPEKEFNRYRLDKREEIFEYIGRLKDLFMRFNPNVKVIFTVSPIRHLKEGLHENQSSKGCLLASLEEDKTKYGIINNKSGFYFPAYEIMMDELRDYRFYADDMVHPSQLAIDYIWECFSKCYFDKDTKNILKEWEEIRKGLNHKPFRTESEAYKSFLKQLVLKIERIKEKCPYLDVQKEIETCHTLLNR